MNFFKYLFLLFPILYISCGNDMNDDMNETSNFKTLKFKYEGVNYSSTYELQNSLVIIHDDYVNSIYQELAQNENLAIYEKSNGDLEIYDNIQDLQKVNNLVDSDERKNTKGIWVEYPDAPDCSVEFYMSNNYNGDTLYDGIFYIKGHESHPYVGDYFNDRFSSMKAYVRGEFQPRGQTQGYCIAIFKDANFRGATRVIELGSNSTRFISDFRDIHYGSGLSWHRWNDEVSSVKTYYKLRYQIVGS